MLPEEFQKTIHTLNKDQIHEAWSLLKVRFSNIQSVEAVSFRIGETVSFPTKYGSVNGVVSKINRTTISVTTARGNWKVSPSLLTKEGVNHG